MKIHKYIHKFSLKILNFNQTIQKYIIHTYIYVFQNIHMKNINIQIKIFENIYNKQIFINSNRN